MKNRILSFLIFLSSILCTNGAIAQNKPLACQIDTANGLSWHNSRWVNYNFPTGKFILVQTKDTLTIESVANAIDAIPSHVSCRTSPISIISCNDFTGGNIIFDPKTLKGGISQIFGATMIAERRDTVSVKPFSCANF